MDCDRCNKLKLVYGNKINKTDLEWLKQWYIGETKVQKAFLYRSTQQS